MFLTSSTGDQCDENQTNPVKICLSQLAQQFAFFCMLLRIVSELAASISAPSLILTHSLELPCVPYYNNIHSLAEEVKLKLTRCKGAYQRDVFRKKKNIGNMQEDLVKHERRHANHYSLMSKSQGCESLPVSVPWRKGKTHLYVYC